MKKNHPASDLTWQLWENNRASSRHWLLAYFPRLQTVFKNLNRLNIILSSDKEIRKLNRQFFHRRRSTDVIAFRYLLKEIPEPARNSFPDGDIFLNPLRAKIQAKYFGNTFRQELLTLLIHGLLHLAGFDDRTKVKQKKMFKQQEKILRWLNSFC